MASGKTAVQTSKKLRRLQDATTEGEADGSYVRSGRYVAGRLFKLRSGVWTDSHFRKGMKVLKLKWMGAAYLKLLKLRPKLKKVLALGKRVLVVVGKKRAVLIGRGGAADIKLEKLKKWLAR